MPWPEINVMDVRMKFVTEAQRERQPFVALCRQYGICPKTGYKWLERFREHGRAGLYELSRRPQNHPARLTEEVIFALVRLKQRHQAWGPKKIRELLINSQPALAVPSLSTVKRVLDRCGLVERRRRRKAVTSGRLSLRLQPTAPNQLWTVDFKGSWYSSEQERIEPLTVRDAFSRYLLCARTLIDSRTQTVRACFEELFRRHGLPEAIRSDNGTPFACSRAPLGLSQLSAWWLALGIRLDRITPGCPQENGAHERMHRDIARELESANRGSLAEQQAALEIWRREYNELRPHEALGLQRPAEHYRNSTRRYDPRPFELEYPAEYFRRLVTRQGSIKLAGCSLQISSALRGWHVGLQAQDEGVFQLWFAELPLGRIDLAAESFVVSR